MPERSEEQLRRTHMVEQIEAALDGTIGTVASIDDLSTSITHWRTTSADETVARLATQIEQRIPELFRSNQIDLAQVESRLTALYPDQSDHQSARYKFNVWMEQLAHEVSKDCPDGALVRKYLGSITDVLSGDPSRFRG